MAFNVFMESIGTNWSVGAPDGIWYGNTWREYLCVKGSYDEYFTGAFCAAFNRAASFMIWHLGAAPDAMYYRTDLSWAKYYIMVGGSLPSLWFQYPSKDGAYTLYSEMNKDSTTGLIGATRWVLVG